MSVSALSSFAATSFAIALSAACGPVQVEATPSVDGDTAVDELVAAIRADLAAEYESKLDAAVAGIAKRYKGKLEGNRRRLASKSDFTGLAIKRDAAGVTLGLEDDVKLLRTGAGELAILADVDVVGSVNVTEDLLVQDRNVLGELDTMYSCSYASDAAARCADGSSEYKMSNCCDGGGSVHVCWNCSAVKLLCCFAVEPVV